MICDCNIFRYRITLSENRRPERHPSMVAAEFTASKKPLILKNKRPRQHINPFHLDVISEYVTKSEFNAATGCHSPSFVTLDPWLCVPAFQQVCLYIYSICFFPLNVNISRLFWPCFCPFFPESAILLSVKKKEKSI